MLSNITSNSTQETTLKPGQKVYLYGDRSYEDIFSNEIAAHHQNKNRNHQTKQEVLV